jgi:hypothetical protein
MFYIHFRAPLLTAQVMDYSTYVFVNFRAPLLTAQVMDYSTYIFGVICLRGDTRPRATFASRSAQDSRLDLCHLPSWLQPDHVRHLPLAARKTAIIKSISASTMLPPIQATRMCAGSYIVTPSQSMVRVLPQASI